MITHRKEMIRSKLLAARKNIKVKVQRLFNLNSPLFKIVLSYASIA
jgi:hypothetical protein